MQREFNQMITSEIIYKHTRGKWVETTAIQHHPEVLHIRTIIELLLRTGLRAVVHGPKYKRPFIIDCREREFHARGVITLEQLG